MGLRIETKQNECIFRSAYKITELLSKNIIETLDIQKVLKKTEMDKPFSPIIIIPVYKWVL